MKTIKLFVVALLITAGSSVMANENMAPVDKESCLNKTRYAKSLKQAAKKPTEVKTNAAGKPTASGR